MNDHSHEFTNTDNGPKLISDLRLQSTDEADKNGAAASAVAQMVIADGVAARATDDALIVNTIALAQLRFLDSATLADQPGDEYDLKAFLDQSVIRGSSAVLIQNPFKPDLPDEVLILTAGHSVVCRDIDKTYFIFDRDCGPNHGDHLSIPFFKRTVHKAIGTYKFANRRRSGDDPLADFCLIRLSQASQEELAARALPLRLDFPSDIGDGQLFSVSHPLGLPSKRSAASVSPKFVEKPWPVTVWCDFAAGGSGAPLLYAPKPNEPVVLGIIIGQARLTCSDRVRRAGRWVILPARREPDDQSLPKIVSAQTIRDFKAT